jgi:beta-1,2-mannobiose phosphorylase / 1,2-beta-oligomannan phosphorylase
LPAIRSLHNPILDATSLEPSSPDRTVVGVFNAGVAALADGVVLLLLRVAEAPHDVPKSEVAAPVFDVATGKIAIRRWARAREGVIAGADSRVFHVDGSLYLTSISHLRAARSHDGVHFVVDPAPLVVASTALEAFGVEDPRITRLDDAWWVTYTAVSSAGIATGLLRSTDDLRSCERRGIIFAPPNRDVAIFPERIGGRAVALHRPMPEGLGEPSIWIASSPNLEDWGGHRLVAGPRAGAWDDAKIGAGAVPFKIVRDGKPAWLAIYHGVTKEPTTYALGALLLDYERPDVVLGRSRRPFLSPEAPYEREGFFGRVVFTCGAIPSGDGVRIYYGAADGVTCVADVPLATILEDLA